MQTHAKLMRLLRALAKSRSGSTAVQMAFVAPAMLMFILGIMEVGRVMWLQNALNYSVVEPARCISNSPSTCGSARQTQSFAASQSGAADAAAYTAVTALSKGASVAQLTTEARSIAAKYGFTSIQGNSTLTVNSPPLSGSYAGKSTAVEVIISQPQTPLISGVFMSSGPTIQTRSVAAEVTTGSGCVVALDRGDVVDVTDSGNTILNLNSCSLYINSNDAAALT